MDHRIGPGAATRLLPRPWPWQCWRASCATWFDAVEDAYRSAGAIAARPPVPANADAQTVLLARFGRPA